MNAYTQFVVFRRCDRKSRKIPPAFTLVELVVVIGVLGLLLLTALARPPNKAYQTGCINNLRQVGNALYMFTEDNGDSLPPGPLPPGYTVMAPPPGFIYFLGISEQPVYSGTTSTSNYKKQLVYYLSTFLSLPAPSSVPNQIIVAKAFLCPGYTSTFPNNSCGTLPGSSGILYNPLADTPPYANAYCYSITRSTNHVNGSDYWTLPAGWPFGKENANAALKLALVASQAHLSDIWAAADFDCKAVSSPSGLGGIFQNGYVAANPVHGNVRNFLYFDNHVGTKKVTGPQDY